MKTAKLDLETNGGMTSAFVALPAGMETSADTASAKTNAAAVILIHEWWGINDHMRDIAGRYAAEGFVCVAPDLYRGKTARDTQEASRMMQELTTEDGLDIIRRAIAETQSAYGVSKVCITGYCMGGTFALRAACEIETLGAAAPFYGDIPEEEKLAQLSVPTLFIAAKLDNWITPSKVKELEDAASKHNLPVEVISYDADHAFFNDTRPEVYHPVAAQDAWQRVLKLFREHLHQ
ncbi:MAG TPA: dienelactone hydrolase family protein [Pyrinomonadaceae bacterium]|jgi:carboxymethylenebutenolidase|nr:dienelactone hydrolase family protein [Pyrinomonadaceae bacterium]